MDRRNHSRSAFGKRKEPPDIYDVFRSLLKRKIEQLAQRQEERRRNARRIIILSAAAVLSIFALWLRSTGADVGLLAMAIINGFFAIGVILAARSRRPKKYTALRSDAETTPA